MSDLVESLRMRAVAAQSEGNATALGDALHFEDAAKRIEALEAALGRLVCLDVTTREGQAAFAEWRNKYERKDKL